MIDEAILSNNSIIVDSSSLLLIGKVFKVSKSNHIVAYSSNVTISKLFSFLSTSGFFILVVLSKDSSFKLVQSFMLFKSKKESVYNDNFSNLEGFFNLILFIIVDLVLSSFV